MKALVLEKYGSPATLKIQDVPQPEPGDDELLIRVHASSVNDWDWSMIRGTPFFIRLMSGLFRPRKIIPGVDVAGIVETVGKNVTAFQTGDAVYGDLSDCGFGAFAEYVCAPETALTKMPNSMNFHDAASLPHAAMLAVQGLLDLGQLHPQKKLLINGAGGGVGSIGVQIAKHLGVEDVTGVDHGDKFDMMRSAGFSSCIDYRDTDFTDTEEKYDLILDAKTTRTPTRYLRALKPSGIYVTVGGETGKLLQLALLSPILHQFTSKRLKILPLKPNLGMSFLNEVYLSGGLTSVVQQTYHLEDISNALTHFGSAEHLGKVVIDATGNNTLQGQH